MHKVWHIVVQVGKGNAIFCANGLTDNDFIDVVKLVPILVPRKVTIRLHLDQAFDAGIVLTQHCDL